MPRPRRRLRWWLKWACTTLWLLIAIAWPASAWGYVSLVWGHCAFLSAGGTLGVELYLQRQFPFDVDSGRWREEHEDSHKLFMRWSFFSFFRNDQPAGVVINVPHWFVLLILAVPMAYLWWRDRRPPPGHCRACGYDLTGNVSGICPECGEKV